MNRELLMEWINDVEKTIANMRDEIDGGIVRETREDKLKAKLLALMDTYTYVQSRRYYVAWTGDTKIVPVSYLRKRFGGSVKGPEFTGAYKSLVLDGTLIASDRPAIGAARTIMVLKKKVAEYPSTIEGGTPLGIWDKPGTQPTHSSSISDTVSTISTIKVDKLKDNDAIPFTNKEDISTLEESNEVEPISTKEDKQDMNQDIPTLNKINKTCSDEALEVVRDYIREHGTNCALPSMADWNSDCPFRKLKRGQSIYVTSPSNHEPIPGRVLKTINHKNYDEVVRVG